MNRTITTLYLITIASLFLLNCTAGVKNSSSAGGESNGTNAAVSSAASPIAPDALPLQPSSALPSGIEATLDPNASRASASSSNDSATEQTSASAAAQSDVPILEGDLSRYQYAFFTKTMADFGSSQRWPFTGVVFTADANFCVRDAAPMHVADFTMYQVDAAPGGARDANIIYNLITWPEIQFSFSPWDPDHLPPGSDLVGWRGSCDLAGYPQGGRSFREASWSLTPQDADSIDSASLIRISIHARNNAQEIAWTLDAKRCDATIAYFQDYGGNHIRPQTIACVRTLIDPPLQPQNPNTAINANKTSL